MHATCLWRPATSASQLSPGLLLPSTKQSKRLVYFLSHYQAQNDLHRLLCPSVGAERLSLLGALVFSKKKTRYLIYTLAIKRLYIKINLCCQPFNTPKVDLFDPVCLGGSSLFVQQNAEQAQARSLDNDLSHDSLSFIEVQTLR